MIHAKELRAPRKRRKGAAPSPIPSPSVSRYYCRTVEAALNTAGALILSAWLPPGSRLFVTDERGLVRRSWTRRARGRWIEDDPPSEWPVGLWWVREELDPGLTGKELSVPEDALTGFNDLDPRLYG